MRLGLLGGSFDPVHWGHLLLAEAAREACQLDEVRFVPTATQPHKRPGVTGRVAVEGKHRLAMLEFATSGLPQFTVSDAELRRGGVSYTVDTLTAVREAEPEAELFFLVGADSLDDLPKWREPERIAELAEIVAVNRGFGPAEIPAELPGAVTDRVRTVDMPACGISSSEIRDRTAAGRSILFQTPRPVEIYIREHGLYSEDGDAV